VDERRAHQRFACDLRTRVLLADGREYEGQAVDISFSGICIHTDEVVPPRTAAEFQVWVVLPERETNQITMPGRIVWCTPIEGSIQIGATFDRNMDNRAWARLDVLLQFLAGNLESSDRL
jgi:hypothetical protein